MRREATNPTDKQLIRLAVLFTIAANIMSHMKTVKEANEKRRAIYMNMCMADFINPEHRFRSRQMRPPKFSSPPDVDNNSRVVEPHQTGQDVLSSRPIAEKGISNPDRRLSVPHCPTSRIVTFVSDEQLCRRRDLSRSPGPTPRTDSCISNEQHEYFGHKHITRLLDTTEPGLPPQHKDTSTGILGEDKEYGLDADPDRSRGRPPGRPSRSSTSSMSPKPSKNVTEADYQRTFDRAAYLLRQSLDLSAHGGGGVVLLDANAGAESMDPVSKRRDSKSGEMNTTARRPGAGPRQKSEAGSKADRFDSLHSGIMQERVVLATASISDSAEHIKNFGRADSTWKVTLTPPELCRMCTRHPRGKLYNIPESVGTTLFDYEGRAVAGRLSLKLYELVLLHRQFPEAKQVMFVPMYHANLNRWTSCFAFTNSRYRIFDYALDYLPMLSFTNAVKAEIVRIATAFTDQQKSLLLNSMSHGLST